MLVPKDTAVAFSTFATHRSPKLYGEDANRFCIDRWKYQSVKERLVDWSYHPFLGGPRKCLGGKFIYTPENVPSGYCLLTVLFKERFALDEAKYLTCRFLQHFNAITASDENGNILTGASDGSWMSVVKYHVGLTMSPDEGVWVRLVSAT